MSNTVLRILSAIVLIALVLLAVWFGRSTAFLLVCLCSLLAIDEVHTKLFKRKRAAAYFISQLLFILPACFLVFGPYLFDLNAFFIYLALGVNSILLIYLFSGSLDSKWIHYLFDRVPFLTSLLIGPSMVSLLILLEMDDWRKFLASLLVINFSMDTGAWFFGKNFGKHKLWQRISPKKTIEGLIGGMLCSGLLGSVAWHLFFESFNYWLFVFFLILGALSQVGDLVQSKIKRQCGVKDSSQLIPGHGGVYDRIDSLVFLTPFYTFVLSSFYLG